MKQSGEGFLCIDKPEGMSSFAVVAAVRRRFSGVKAGHAGTLDPAASGLLVLALGNATRLLPFVPLEPKQYRFGIRFGAQTDTLDADGTIVKIGGSIPSAAAFEAALTGFCGESMQAPPEYSAVKVGGVRAYRLARQGRRVELAPRRIEIFSLHAFEYDEAAGQALLEVSCSGGTYVRSLARDIAETLGTCGYASSLRRIAAGNFHVDRSLVFDALDRVKEALLPVYEVLRGLPRVTVDTAQKGQLARGCDIIVELAENTESTDGNSPIFAFDVEKNIVAVLKRKEGTTYHPVRVFLKG
ncbi:MAG: tRNA pseudouridine(55) synthase TruB [Chitinispirillaceae bacterium]